MSRSHCPQKWRLKSHHRGTPDPVKVLAEEGLWNKPWRRENVEQWQLPDQLQRVGLAVVLTDLPARHLNSWQYQHFPPEEKPVGTRRTFLCISVWRGRGRTAGHEDAPLRVRAEFTESPAAVFWHPLAPFNGGHTSHKLVLPMGEGGKDSEAGLFLGSNPLSAILAPQQPCQTSLWTSVNDVSTQHCFLSVLPPSLRVRFEWWLMALPVSLASLPISLPACFSQGPG